MRMVDLIVKKQNGKELTTEEIEFFVKGYTDGSIPDYQASALAMAIYFQDMTDQERADLTMAMVNSGKRLISPPLKALRSTSTLRAGSATTTLVLAPLVAALGVPVAKMSGRGLGHTGEPLISWKRSKASTWNYQKMNSSSL